MAAVGKHKPGEFSWTDLGTKDVAGAKKFYQGLFGWKGEDFPMGPGDERYTIMRLKGKDVCGLYPMPGEHKKMKSPPSWLAYVAVKDVDVSVKKAKAARGKLVMGPMDVMGQGRMAIVVDPTGAGIALWQAAGHSGAALEGVPGAVTWHDLNTLKPKAAGKFYTSVFGWKLSKQDIDGQPYFLFKLGKESVCGMWPEPTKKLPPSWLTHWKVAVCANTVKKAKRLGGRVLLGPIGVEGMGHFAILKDPQGAAFGIIGK
jgi:predicted enzyme related to lactoylglutathione lyase